MSLKNAIAAAKRNVKKGKPLMEADKTEARVARIISRYTARLGKEFITSKPSDRVGIQAALTVLNQAQILVQTDMNEARNLLAVARRLSNVRDEDE
jgi:hypothetical protein